MWKKPKNFIFFFANVFLMANMVFFFHGEASVDKDWLLLMKQGRAEEASGALENAVAREPGNIKFHLALAHCYYVLRQGDLAYKQCQIVLGLDPRNADALFLKSKLLQYQFSLRKLDFVEEAVRLDPSNPAFLREMGTLYYNLKNYEKAEKWLIAVQAIQRQRDPGFYFILGNVESSLSHFSEAEKAYQVALTLSPPTDLRQNILEARGLLVVHR